MVCVCVFLILKISLERNGCSNPAMLWGLGVNLLPFLAHINLNEGCENVEKRTESRNACKVELSGVGN